jgi:Transposase DDE domain
VDSGGGGAAAVVGPGLLPIVSSRAGPLWDELSAAYDILGSSRPLAETGVDPVPSYATLKRRLPAWGPDAFRRKLAAACAEHAALGPASLVLYDVSTLYFETDAGDGFREPGFSTERRLQITIRLLTDAAGFPLMVEAFEGNTAENTTMLPTIRAFMAAHRLTDVTVVADAGMISAGNQRAIEAAGLSFIVGTKIPDIPYVVTEWRRQPPDVQPPDGLILTQPRPGGPRDQRRDEVVYYQYRADRARRTLHGIDEQVTKAERAVAGKAPVKRNRFITLTDADKSVKRTLEAKARALAGWKGYLTNLAARSDGAPVTAEFVIDAWLFAIEASFRMSKHDLAARPIYHHKRESIDAHLTVVFAALAVGRLAEERIGWSIRRFVRTARRYRTVQIRAGKQLITAADPVPGELRDALNSISHTAGAHQFEPSRVTDSHTVSGA